jgi:hypothetical protein
MVSRAKYSIQMTYAQNIQNERVTSYKDDEAPAFFAEACCSVSIIAGEAGCIRHANLPVWRGF